MSETTDSFPKSTDGPPPAAPVVAPVAAPTEAQEGSVTLHLPDVNGEIRVGGYVYQAVNGDIEVPEREVSQFLRNVPGSAYKDSNSGSSTPTS